MRERQVTFSLETLLYLTLMVLAAWIRLTRLGWLPLNDREAAHALTAAAATAQGSPFWEVEGRPTPTNSAYHVLTSVVFSLVGSSDAAARFIPAMAGLALVLTPLLLRRRLGQGTALVMAFLFAISPALLTESRTAGGASLSVLGISLTLALAFGAEAQGSSSSKRGRWAAAALGFTLTTGPEALVGLLGLLLGVVVFAVASRDRTMPRMPTPIDGEMRSRLWIGGLALLVIASGVGLFMEGIPGLFESLGNWVSGWRAFGGVRAWTAMFALLAYEPMSLAFGLIGLVSAMRTDDPFWRGMAAWLVGAVSVVLIYPGRDMGDLVWAVVPLTAFASRTIATLLNRLERPRVWFAFWGLVAVLLLLTSFSYMQLIAYDFNFVGGAGGFDPNLNLGLAVMGLGLAILAMVFYGFGWSWSDSLDAGGITLALTLLALTFSGGWRLNFNPSAASGAELWRSETSTLGLPVLVEILETVSEVETGRRDSLEVSLQDEPPPALAWALREFKLASTQGATAEFAPPVVLMRERAQEQLQPAISSEYLGQEKVIAASWGWMGILPPQPISWWIGREAPTEAERWLLFVRADIAGLGEQSTDETETSP